MLLQDTGYAPSKYAGRYTDYGHFEDNTMSTNFYFVPTEGPLAAIAEIHIGKRSGGWEFCFQAHNEEGGERRVEVGPTGLSMKVNVPRLVIKSYEDWKTLLRSTPGHVMDEYHTVYSQEEFEAIVAELSPGKTWQSGQPLKNHYDYLTQNADTYGALDPKWEWKDAEGFSFSLTNFS